jgi:hypothetical protein
MERGRSFCVFSVTTAIAQGTRGISRTSNCCLHDAEKGTLKPCPVLGPDPLPSRRVRLGKGLGPWTGGRSSEDQGGGPGRPGEG